MRNTDQERTRLARIRTIMANERTLMSFYRTSFAIIGVATFIYKFYLSQFSAIVSAVMLFVGIGVAIYGTLRFRRFRKKFSKEMPADIKEDL